MNLILKVAPALATMLVFLAAVQMLWFAGRLPITVAPPSAIIGALISGNGALWFHLQTTLVAALLGFAVCCAAAIILTLVAHFVPLLRDFINNLAVAIYALPLIALAPTLVIWFGTGPTVRVIIAALAGFYPVMVGCLQGLQATESAGRELMRVLAASPWQRFRLLELPTAMPFVFSGLKISAASAFLGAIVAEWTGAERGLGMFMAYALFSFNVPQVWAAMVVCVITALASYLAVAGIERVVVTWDVPEQARGAL